MNQHKTLYISQSPCWEIHSTAGNLSTPHQQKWDGKEALEATMKNISDAIIIAQNKLAPEEHKQRHRYFISRMKHARIRATCLCVVSR